MGAPACRCCACTCAEPHFSATRPACVAYGDWPPGGTGLSTHCAACYTSNSGKWLICLPGRSRPGPARAWLNRAVVAPPDRLHAHCFRAHGASKRPAVLGGAEVGTGPPTASRASEGWKGWKGWGPCGCTLPRPRCPETGGGALHPPAIMTRPPMQARRWAPPFNARPMTRPPAGALLDTSLSAKQVHPSTRLRMRQLALHPGRAHNFALGPTLARPMQLL